MELVSRRICNIKTTQMLWVKDLALLLKIDRWAQTFNLPLNNSLYIFKCWCSLHATSYPVSSSDVLGVPRLVFTHYVESENPFYDVQIKTIILSFRTMCPFPRIHLKEKETYYFSTSFVPLKHSDLTSHLQNISIVVLFNLCSSCSFC